METSIKKQIEETIRLRARAKNLESEAKTIIKHCKSVLLPIMTAYEIEKYKLKGVGEIALRTNKGNNIDATKLKEALLLHGHTMEEIKQIMFVASSSWETEYIGFKMGSS